MREASVIGRTADFAWEAMDTSAPAAAQTKGVALVRLKTEENSATVVLRVEEARIDAHNSGELKIAIADLFAAGRRAVLADLSQVDFMDSSGLSALISGYKTASVSGGALRLAGLRPQVRSIFELTRLHRVFEIFPDAAQGIESFRVPHDSAGE